MSRHLFVRVFTAVLVLCASGAGTLGQEHASGGLDFQPRVTLSLDDGRQVFRMGEPIRATLTFTGSTDGVRTDDLGSYDEWRFTPDTPVVRWRDRYRQIFGPRHAAGNIAVGAGPVRRRLSIHEHVRFDEPGTYTLSIATSRAVGMRLVSNAVSFQILPMTEREAAVEVSRIMSELDAGLGDGPGSGAFIDRLVALEGEAATRERVRLLLAHPEDPGFARLRLGLFRSRDVALAIDLLERALQDLTVVPSTRILATLVNLRLWTAATDRELERHPEIFMLRGQVELTRAYAEEIVASLSARSTDNQRDTALMLLELSWALPTPAEVGQIMLNNLGSLDRRARARVLARHWEALRNASLTPELIELISDRQNIDGGDRGLLLGHLIEASPARARALVIREILDVESDIWPEYLTRLPDVTLPEVDAPLLASIEAYAEDSDRAARAATLLARFGSPSVLARALETFDRIAHEPPTQVSIGLLAYLARWNEPSVLSRIHDASRAADAAGQLFWWEFAQLHYSQEVEAVLISRLELPAVDAAMNAAHLLGMRGTAAAGEALRRRLDRWNTDRRDAARLGRTDLDARFDPALQTVLVEALVTERAWQLSSTEIESLRSHCVAAECTRALRGR